VLVLVGHVFPSVARGDSTEKPLPTPAVTPEAGLQRLQVAWMVVGLVAGLVTIVSGCLAIAYWLTRWPTPRQALLAALPAFQAFALLAVTLAGAGCVLALVLYLNQTYLLFTLAVTTTLNALFFFRLTWSREVAGPAPRASTGLAGLPRAVPVPAPHGLSGSPARGTEQPTADTQQAG
jgi:hypothetical protein